MKQLNKHFYAFFQPNTATQSEDMLTNFFQFYDLIKGINIYFMFTSTTLSKDQSYYEGTKMLDYWKNSRQKWSGGNVKNYS